MSHRPAASPSPAVTPPPVVREAGDLLWNPTPASMSDAALGGFVAWLADERDLGFNEYWELWRWSTDHLEDFWEAVWQYFNVGTADPCQILPARTMPGAEWFTGARVNYAQEVLRRAPPEGPALIAYAENGPRRELTRGELRAQVGALGATLRRIGVGPGDRVAAYLPNVPEAVVGLLATASVGALWTVCAPDFGTQSVLDRFAQVAPLVLLTGDGYRFNGRWHDRRAQVDALRGGLPTVRETIVLAAEGEAHPPRAGTMSWTDAVGEPAEPQFADLPFKHPLWILFSSGTTGIPKGIVQSHGGIVLEHLKGLSLGSDVRASDRFYFFSSTSWMVWNWLVSGLLVGATPVLYSGSPGYPDVLGSWKIVADSGAQVFGTGAAYLAGCEKADAEPGRTLELTGLRSVISTGSPLPTSTWSWVSNHVSATVRIDSSCGGTDVCGALLSGSPWLPVHVGELSAPCLGVNAQTFDDDGVPVDGDVGELVILGPMPSMPIFFWNDPDGSRYRDAYFARFPGAWRHGDWVEFTERGSAIVRGRSDATLNKAGVRMGSADIYAIVDPLPGVADSLVLGIELPDGDYYMPLFVVLEDGADLDELRGRIIAAIRHGLSPRHLPDDIIAAPAVPRTLTGKKLEVPIKRMLQGASGADVVSAGAVSNANALAWYEEFGRRQPRTASR